MNQTTASSGLPAAGYLRLVSIRRRLEATFSHDDSLLRYSRDFFTLERRASTREARACPRLENGLFHPGDLSRWRDFSSHGTFRIFPSFRRKQRDD